MGNVYSCVTGFQTVSAAQDLIQVAAGTGSQAKLLFMEICQSSDAGSANDELLQITLKIATGAYTGGAGGASVVPAKLIDTVNDAQMTDSPDAAPTANRFERNNTTAATGGTITTVYESVFNVPAGTWQFLPPPEMRFVARATDALILAIAAPTDALTLSATMMIEED